MHLLKKDLAAWLLVFLFFIPGPAYGQSLEDEYEEGVIEEVTVTGSRLIRSNLDSPSPVTIFNAQQLKDTGITTLGEFARYLPQNADNISDSNSTNRPVRGSSGFNLRGIGLDGTLTLVNGRRVAPFGSSGDEFPFVDINSIPVAAIERIEVLKDGASAIYGSEAVAGVVNIITRKVIDGVVVEGGYMTTAEGDGDEWDVNIAGGWSSGSTNISATLSYFEREVIYGRDREFSSDIDLSGQGGRNGRSSASSPPTIDLLESRLRRADPACPEHTSLNTRQVFGVAEFCTFNWAAFASLQNPSDRFGLTSYLDHEFSSGLSLFAEILYSRNNTQSTMAPTPMFGFFVPDYHPDNPFGEDLRIRTRTLDTGDRGFDTKVTSWRALTGVRGLVSDWEWEVALMASESESDDSRFNATLIQEFRDALVGLGGPNGDQFYNPFGLNTQNPPEVVEQFLISGIGTVQTSRELTADFQVTGNFGALWGGPVGAAFGGQARAQSLKQSADEEEQSGNIGGSGGPRVPIDAERDIYSVFAEFLLPLHEKFEVQLAVRYDDYSDFGSTTNPKIGLGWRPWEEVLLRATWGTSFRPPTFRELYDPLFEDFGEIVDIHRCPVTGDFFDCFGRDVETEFHGNPDLEPDEGETMLIGVAWEPSKLEGLALSLDFWQIEHKNRILNSADFVVSEILFELLDPATNPFMIRAPQSPEDVALGIPGILLKASSTYINGDTLKTNGIDFDLSYIKNSAHSGTFSLTLNYTYLNEFRFGTDYREAVFEEDWAGGYGFTNGLPKHRANLRLGWERNAHGLSALIAYAGEYESWENLYVDNQETDLPFVVDDYMQLDLQYRYVFSSLRDGMLSVGCRNCTDKDPPVYNYETAAEAFHEGRGAMLYARWSQPFR